jgi:glutamate-1-semialdehyde 2,1-aminomutase
MGHGSLLFGHNDPEILAAMQAQLPLGTHLGAGHELEVQWAEEVSRLMPSAELVKFTGSGTESTLLAIRVARSATQRPTIVKLEGHFHGWNDYLLKAEKAPFDQVASPGIPMEVMDTIAVVPNNDLAALEARLSQGDVAALIMEPSGGSWATIPLIEGYLQAARDLTTKYGALLIFDEVITGFRWSPGGAQVRYGVTPDITTMAKVVAGGMPGGAVGGTRDVMDVLIFKDEPGWNSTRKVRHQGTYNASPVVSALAQRACARLPIRRCSSTAMVWQRSSVPGSTAPWSSGTSRLRVGESSSSTSGSVKRSQPDGRRSALARGRVRDRSEEQQSRHVE